MPAPTTRPKMTVEVDFINDPTASTETWTDVTAFCRARGESTPLLSTNRGRDYELSRVATGTASLVLDNTDGRFDPTNLSSPYYTGTGNPGGVAGLVIPGRRLRIRATWSGTTYDVFRGTVDRWPQTWGTAGFYGEANVQLVDAFAFLAAVDLPALNVYQSLTDNPLAFYRCNDSAGSVSAANISSNNLPLSAIVAGSTAASTDSFAFGSDAGTGVLIGDPTTSLQFSTQSWNPSLGANTSGYALRTADLGVGPLLQLSGGFSVEFYMKTSNSTKNANATLFYQTQQAGGVSSQVNVYLATPPVGPGLSIVFSSLDRSSGSATILGTTNVADGAWHHIVCILSADNKTPFLFIDGISQTGNQYPSAAPILWNAPYLNEWGGDPRPTYKSGTGYYDGNLKNLVLIQGATSSLRVAANYAAGLGFPGDSTATRQGRILDAAGWPTSQRTLATGDSTHGPQATEGQKALAALQTVADTEGAPVYVGPNGTVRQDARSARLNTTTALAGTFGENPGELHYLDDIGVDVDTKDIYNDVLVARVGGITVRVQDSASQLRYGPRSLSLESSASSDAQAVYLAEYLVARYKTPFARIPQITLDPLTQPALWPVVLGLALGARLTVSRRPGKATAFTRDFFVEKISHAVTSSSWRTTLLLSPSEVTQVFELDSSTFGHFGGSSTLAASTTAGATTISSTGVVFSSTDVPYPVVVDSEQMTVTAVSGAGPQTLTVTRGAGGSTAAAHSSGATVSVTGYGFAY